MKTTTYYEVTDGHGGIGKNSQYTFETEAEALAMATEFKNNPRSHNESMTDDNVKYWKNKIYTVVRKTIETENLSSI
jgi:hypothetical protein